MDKFFEVPISVMKVRKVVKQESGHSDNSLASVSWNLETDSDDPETTPTNEKTQKLAHEQIQKIFESEPSIKIRFSSTHQFSPPLLTENDEEMDELIRERRFSETFFSEQTTRDVLLNASIVSDVTSSFCN